MGNLCPGNQKPVKPSLTPPQNQNNATFADRPEPSSSTAKKVLLAEDGRAALPAYPASESIHNAVVDNFNGDCDGELPAVPFAWKSGEYVGAGAFGQVRRGLVYATGQEIAVKQVSIPRDAENIPMVSRAIRALESEVAVLKTLRHPNIVRYIGTERTTDNFNIYLEFMPCGSLHSKLSHYGALPEDTIRVYTLQMLSGIHYLHSENIMHRDIKGANILVDGSGVVKLADFGASKVIETLSSASGAKSMVGTLNWMAPEVMKGTPYGRAADIWSLACVVYEMATGHAPWHHIEERMALMYHIVNAREPPELPDTLSAPAHDFLSLCFARVPRERPGAAALLQHPWLRGVVLPRAARAAHGASLTPSQPPAPGAFPPDAARTPMAAAPPLGLRSPPSTIPEELPSPAPSSGAPATHWPRKPTHPELERSVARSPSPGPGPTPGSAPSPTAAVPRLRLPLAPVGNALGAAEGTGSAADPLRSSIGLPMPPAAPPLAPGARGTPPGPGQSGGKAPRAVVGQAPCGGAGRPAPLTELFNPVVEPSWTGLHPDEAATPAYGRGTPVAPLATPTPAASAASGALLSPGCATPRSALSGATSQRCTPRSGPAAPSRGLPPPRMVIPGHQIDASCEGGRPSPAHHAASPRSRTPRQQQQPAAGPGPGRSGGTPDSRGRAARSRYGAEDPVLPSGSACLTDAARHAKALRELARELQAARLEQQQRQQVMA